MLLQHACSFLSCVQEPCKGEVSVQVSADCSEWKLLESGRVRTWAQSRPALQWLARASEINSRESICIRYKFSFSGLFMEVQPTGQYTDPKWIAGWIFHKVNTLPRSHSTQVTQYPGHTVPRSRDRPWPAPRKPLLLPAKGNYHPESTHHWFILLFKKSLCKLNFTLCKIYPCWPGSYSQFVFRTASRSIMDLFYTIPISPAGQVEYLGTGITYSNIHWILIVINKVYY